MKFNHKKHDIEQFAYDLKGLGIMIGMSDEQVIEHIKGAFPPTILAQLLDMLDDTNVALGK